MVAVKEKFIHHEDGSIDLPAWLRKIHDKKQLKNLDLVTKAAELAEHTSKGLTTFYGQPVIEQGLEMAEIILDLNLDQEAIAASIIVSTAQHTNLKIETITAQLGENIAKLVTGVSQMNVINNLAKIKTRDQTQIDRLRKTLLAMVSDIRVVLIKLAERTCLMRGIKKINPTERKRLAQETMDIYAPLANRLGVGQLKWELEDFAFHYIDPDTYKTIANFLAERRADREKLIHETIAKLKENLDKTHIEANITGRAKHIYSIFMKQQRKHLDYKHIYDYSAVRILVPSVQDCYQALSIVHGLWEHIPEEFDDYISNPKPNGYSSIHTAVIGPGGKNMEIQIRTRQMHDQAEHGIAAHWIYKENKPTQSGYEAKIAFLRQLLEWHKDVAKETAASEQIQQQFFEDRVYVFTPAGDILDLPAGATPLDFAYQIHTGLGNRCRGAKINGHIVPLSYTLQTGDQVDIITIKEGTPSRDWLNKETGYIKTPRARAKVAQWFRQQEVSQYIESGKHSLEREFNRAGIQHPSLHKIAALFNYKDDDALFAAVGHGTVRPAQVIHAAQEQQRQATGAHIPAITTTKKISPKPTGLQISGADDLLTRIARCCKPIPGDEIIGYITQGRGVSIHRKSCNNLAHLSPEIGGRFLDVSWDQKHIGNYYVDLQIRARGKEDLLKEISGLLPNLKIDLVTLNSTISKKSNMIYITMTIQIHDVEQLHQLTSQLHKLPNIVDIKRIRN
ncbi:MAG: GTP diphosphokinase [Gammaproteobacteria bacterium]